MRHLIIFENFSVNEEEKKKEKKKVADMSDDEKVAMYRTVISNERKKPAPSQAKIEDMKLKIEKVNSDKQTKK